MLKEKVRDKEVKHSFAEHYFEKNFYIQLAPWERCEVYKIYHKTSLFIMNAMNNFTTNKCSISLIVVGKKRKREKKSYQLKLQHTNRKCVSLLSSP